MATRTSLDQFWAQRFADLSAGNYKAIYFSYHPRAPFRENFLSAREYVLFAKAQLSAIEVKDWQFVTYRELADDQVECLVTMQLSCDGVVQYFYELALVVRSEQQWLYHSAQKLSAEDYSGPPEQINFEHFDQVVQKIRL